MVEDSVDSESDDYTCHISRDRSQAWCDVWTQAWMFVSLEHADAAVARGDRLVPCEACIAAARAATS